MKQGRTQENQATTNYYWRTLIFTLILNCKLLAQYVDIIA